MSIDKDEFRASFFEECEELLEAMHDGFDQMAEDEHEEETMHAVFRAVHSIKGGAGAFGLDNLVGFAHHFETALDKVRSGKIELDPELLDLFRLCGDNLSDLVAVARDHGDQPSKGTEALNERLNVVLKEHLDDDEAIEEADFQPISLDLGAFDLPTSDDSYTIHFQPNKSLFSTGNEPAVLFSAIAKLGALDVTVDLEKLPDFDELTPDETYLEWNLKYRGPASEGDLIEVFEFVTDSCSLEISEIESTELSLPVIKIDDSDPIDTTEYVESAAPNITESKEPNEVSPQKQIDKPIEGPKSENIADKRPTGTIRVDLEKIDKLINLVGELVIKEAMLAQSISDLNSSSESEISVGFESLKALAGEIQEGVMAIRAQPVKPMFQRMSRIVREAAAATGKKVKFVTNGEYTEVDKTVIERLVDPLTHMIRNAVDHGLETTEQRVENGKAAEGTVTLSAAHRSGRVMIDVSDDGGGIKREKVKQIAIERNLISENDVLSPQEVDALLFLPGFSSASEISELSGRGVGLDVVRSEIHKLGGRVAIHSDPGEGTTFSISLPLTLAVLEGMVINVAQQTMVVPISAIQETLQPKTAAIHEIGSGGRVVRNRDSLVPIIDVGSYFGFREQPNDLDNHILLLIESDDNHRYALIVDEIQDQRQVVIKSLETNYRQVDGIAAATILGDGRIALILDPDNIVRGSGIRQPMETTMQVAV